MKRESFARHYLKHVALGEGCNCAESVIRTMERPTIARVPGPASRTFYSWVASVMDRFRKRQNADD